MKKGLPLLVLALALALSAGCARQAPEDAAPSHSAPPAAASESAAVSPPQGADTSAQTMEASSISDAPGPLTSSEVLDAYDRAVEAYGWFDLVTLPCTEEIREADGEVYRVVDDPDFGTMEELEQYLRGLFSREIVEDLLSFGGPVPTYRDIDGALCVRSGGRGADLYKGTVAASVEPRGPEAYRVNVTVETLGDDLRTVTGVERRSFPYELVEGSWVFTSFSLVY